MYMGAFWSNNYLFREKNVGVLAKSGGVLVVGVSWHVFENWRLLTNHLCECSTTATATLAPAYKWKTQTKPKGDEVRCIEDIYKYSKVGEQQTQETEPVQKCITILFIWAIEALNEGDQTWYRWPCHWVMPWPQGLVTNYFYPSTDNSKNLFFLELSFEG